MLKDLKGLEVDMWEKIIDMVEIRIVDNRAIEEE